MNIRTKLSIGFSVMGLLILITSAVAYLNISSLETEIRLLSKDRLPKIVWANQIIDQINIGARALRNAILSDNEIESQQQIDRVMETTKIVGPLFDSLHATITSEEGKKLIGSIDEIRPEYIKIREKLFSHIKAGDKAAATSLLFGDFRNVQTQYFDRVASVIDFQTKLMIESADTAEGSASTASLLILITFAIAVLIGLIVSTYLSKNITTPIGRAVDAANSISKGNTKVNLDNENKDETGLLLNAMKTMANNITRLSDELNKTADAAVMGKLDNRGDENAFEGDYKEIIRGFNATLDAVIGPLNVTAEYVDRISKGDIPPRIIDNYNGDFNEIKNNLNQCIDAVNLLVKDAGMLAKAAKEGKLDTRADATRHHGDFRAIVQGVNATLDNVIGPLNVAAEYVDRISKGDIPPKITDNYNGDFNEIKNNLNGCIDAVNALVTDAKMLSKAAIEGKLDTRADATKHGGDFRAIVEGVNATLDNVIGPLNVAAEYIDRISKGDIPPKITDNYNGDFNEIKNNLNTNIDLNIDYQGQIRGINESQAVIEFKPDGTILRANHHFLNALGYTLEEIQGKHHSMFADNAFANSVEYKQFWETLRSGITQSGEYQRFGKGGKEVWIQASYTPIKDMSGVVFKVVKYASDITEQKLLNSDYQGQIRGINESQAVIEFKPDGTILRANHHFLGAVGYSLDEVQGKHHSIFADKEYANSIEYKQFWEALKRGDAQNGEFQRFGKGGKEIWIQASYTPVKDQNGNVFKVVKFASDITAQKNTIFLIIDLIAAAQAGQLDKRIELGQAKGDYLKLRQGVNDLLNAIINPLNVAAEYVDRISKGDIPPKITDNYNGDFNEIKNNLNGCIDAIDMLVSDAKLLAKAAIEGKLDTRADATKHGGDFRAIVEGVNATLDNVIGPLNVAAEYVDRISKGDIPPKITDNYNGDFNEIKNNLNGCIDAVNALVTDAKMLSKAAIEGKLDTRADATKHGGDFRAIVEGVNATLDNVIGPLNVAAEYVDRISKGDIPPRIIDNYNGDFNEIKNNINSLIESTNMVTEVAKKLAVGNTKVELHKRSPGDDMIAGLMAVIDNIKHDAENVINMSKGYLDFDIKIMSEEDEMAKSCVVLQNSLKELVNDTKMLVNAAKEGKLDTRADATKHSGDFHTIVQGVNATLDNVIGPLNVAAEYVDRISKGDIPPKITDNYKGDFNEIKNNLNQAIDAINALVTDAKMLSKAAIEGKLDTRADATKHGGDFREIVEGVNATLDNVIGPLNVAAEYVDRIAKGDIPPKITDNYNGDFNEIKNNLNQAIDAVNMLVTDALMLVDAAERGALQTRADATHHHGDFRKIVDGVNKTLDMVVNPIDETSTIMSIFATGDLTSRILSEYNGDFAKLKNDINKFAESLSDLIMQLTDSIQNTASAAHEISSTAESLAAATQEQSAQADEVANAVEAMSRTITENAMSASRTADVANKNSTMASESGKVVELTVNKMKDIAVVVKNSATNIEQLGESSKQIGEIISVIDDIADQTNLLALNAAIEAARAGEQGRGFAVVADEVRKLAERTTEATKQIAKMIKGIQHETEQAVVAMNKGTMEVQSGIELADKAGESLKQILTSTHEVLDMVNQIAAASEEQSATSEQISKNVIAISKVTADSTSRVEDVAKTADELARMTEQLRDLISSFKVNESGRNFGSGRMLSSRDGKQLTSGW